MSLTPLAGLALCAALLVPLGATAPASAVAPIEDYASYQPATRCSPRPKAGTEELAHWLVRHYGGGFGAISRPCGSSTSEHSEGRAFDWMVSATTRRGRHAARAFLHRLRATDRRGDTDALARRMGVMYVIWDDHLYAAYRGFDPEPYLSASCTRRATCSPTLRHRDHLHVSLSRQGGRGRTSWYQRR